MTDGFLEIWESLSVGSIDGCHIPISVPEGNHFDYYQRKEFYSMILQGLVDTDYHFLDVCIVWAGSVYDTRVFIHSPIYHQITKNNLLPNNNMSVNGVIEAHTC